MSGLYADFRSHSALSPRGPLGEEALNFGSLLNASLVPSYAASPLYSPRELSATRVHIGAAADIQEDLVRRLAEVEVEAKQAELARRFADVDADAKLVVATTREVEAEFQRSRQTIERAYSGVLMGRTVDGPSIVRDDEEDVDGAMDEAAWWAQEQRRREQDTQAWEERWCGTQKS